MIHPLVRFPLNYQYLYLHHHCKHKFNVQKKRWPPRRALGSSGLFVRRRVVRPLTSRITWCLRNWSGPSATGDPRRRGRCLLLKHRPIECVVILMIQSSEQDTEQLSQVHIVWRFFKPQTSAVIQIHSEFGGITLEVDDKTNYYVS